MLPRSRKRLWKEDEKGGGAGKKEKGSFLPVFFLFAVSQFYEPDYLAAWNMRRQSGGIGNSCPRKGGIQ